MEELTDAGGWGAQRYWSTILSGGGGSRGDGDGGGDDDGLDGEDGDGGLVSGCGATGRGAPVGSGLALLALLGLLGRGVRRPRVRTAPWIALACLGAAGCGMGAEGAGDPDVGRVRQGSTVAEHLDTSCDDGVVAGLGRQISEEVGCMAPGALVAYTFDGGLVENASGVMPFMSQSALDALRAAAGQTGVPIYINSGFRTVAAQYLLYNWWQRGRCDLTLVAPPGDSNHESGRALDVQNYGEVVGAMNANGWSHPYPGDDPWHFDHEGSPDIRGMDVHAFQRLWNRNHPEDLIDEDGVYGPATDARLSAAPAEGFPIGTCADAAAEPPDEGPLDDDPADGQDPPLDDEDASGGGDLASGCAAGGGTGAPSGAGLLLLLAAIGVRRAGRTARRGRSRRGGTRRRRVASRW
jgi:hypothetical protein